MPPTFRLQSRLKLVQTERKCKFICDFPPTRYESVGCDDGNFSFLKECDLLLAAYLQTAKQIKISARQPLLQKMHARYALS